MKRIVMLMTAACVMAGASVKAQQVAIGARGGLTIPKITAGGDNKTPLSEGYSSRMTWGAGAFAEIKFTKLFSLQVGLEYSQQGGQKDGVQALPLMRVTEPMVGPLTQQLIGQGLPQAAASAAAAAAIGTVNGLLQGNNYLYADFESTAKFNYLMLPVQAKFGWDLGSSPFRVYVSAGLFGSYLLHGERVSSGSSAIYLNANKTTMTQFWAGVPEAAKTAMGEQNAAMIGGILQGMDQSRSLDNTQDITDDLYRFNCGFIGNAGVAYNFGRNSIFLEGGGNYGFVKIQKNEANGQNRIGAGTVMLGYSYTL